MANVLTIDGKEYTPATIAGKHFGYTKDYLLMLSKGGKIDGKKIGNKWYVYVPSAEEYFASAKRERETRRIRLSDNRKAELKQHSAVRHTQTHNLAIVETLAIVILGLSIGVAGYIGTSSIQLGSANSSHPQIFFKNLALSIYSYLTPGVAFEPLQNLAQNEVPSVVEATTSVQDQGEHAILVAPSDTFGRDTVREVQESFSDPVEITPDPENNNTGIVTPIFKDDRKGDSYRFLLVPMIKK